MNNVKKKSSLSTLVGWLLIALWMTAIPAAGVALGEFSSRGAERLSLHPWIWNVFWACAAVCVATGLYIKNWKHCIGLPMIFLAIGGVGAFDLIADGYEGPLHRLLARAGSMLGLMLAVGVPFICALIGINRAYRKWRASSAL